MESVSVANNEFSLDLLKKITEKNRTGNVFYSPLSISSALAIVSLGARGNTVTQMSESLHLDKAVDNVGLSKLMSEVNKEGSPYKLSVASRLYGEQSYQFVKTFLTAIKKHYNAELEDVDFKSNAETARQNINTWVEKQTTEKIKDLLPKGIVDQITRLVLVNAMYFKGNWEKKFSETSTRDANFRLNKLMFLYKLDTWKPVLT